MKKLLILTLAIFCFYGCRTTSEKSDLSAENSPSDEEILNKLKLSTGLLEVYTNTVCNQDRTSSIQFNGNTYSKMTLNTKYSQVRTDTDPDIKHSPFTDTASEVLEENNGIVTLTSTRVETDNKEYYEKYTFNTKTEKFEYESNDRGRRNHVNMTSAYFKQFGINTIKKFCGVYSSFRPSKVITQPTPSDTFTVNGRSFSTNYTKAEYVNLSDDHYILEYWIATDGDLKNLAIQHIKTNETDPAKIWRSETSLKPYTTTETTIITGYSFIKK